MKLNKNTLQWLIYHALHSNVAGHAELNLIEEIDEALKDDTLEIEGYEKSEWIKFDRGNPDTYPPRNQHIIAYSPGHISTLYCFSKEAETDEQFANNFSVRYGFTHWKPGPKAP